MEDSNRMRTHECSTSTGPDENSRKRMFTTFRMKDTLTTNSRHSRSTELSSIRKRTRANTKVTLHSPPNCRLSGVDSDPDQIITDKDLRLVLDKNVQLRARIAKLAAELNNLDVLFPLDDSHSNGCEETEEANIGRKRMSEKSGDVVGVGTWSRQVQKGKQSDTRRLGYKGYWEKDETGISNVFLCAAGNRC